MIKPCIQCPRCIDKWTHVVEDTAKPQETVMDLSVAMLWHRSMLPALITTQSLPIQAGHIDPEPLLLQLGLQACSGSNLTWDWLQNTVRLSDKLLACHSGRASMCQLLRGRIRLQGMGLVAYLGTTSHWLCFNANAWLFLHTQRACLPLVCNDCCTYARQSVWVRSL